MPQPIVSFLLSVLLTAWCALVAALDPVMGAECAFEVQGEGRVAAIIDGRSFRLDDGREVRLAGIETAGWGPTRAGAPAALSAMLLGQDITLRSQDDTPDRYGRDTAFVFLNSTGMLVQTALLGQGAAVVSSEVVDKSCSAALMAAEAEARSARRGAWDSPSAIKNPESPDDILAGIGRFAVVEGKVLSVRQAGATTYLNFGRNWTRDLAVTIPRRIIPVFETAGVSLKSLENKRIRVRGWVEAHGGPRIEVLRAGQIEVVGRN
jgi:endonuclease YncB( thermonuclease family)